MARFQALSWECSDESEDTPETQAAHQRWNGLASGMRSNRDGDDDEDDDRPEPEPKQFYVFTFGRDAQGASVCVRTPYMPYFYVEAPQGWTPEDGYWLGRRLYLSVGFLYPGCLESVEWTQMMKFDGYRGDRKFGFYKVSLRCQRAYSILVKKLQKEPLKIWEGSRGTQKIQFVVYEGNVDPILRFIHDARLNSTGWVDLDPRAPQIRPQDQLSLCALEYRAAGVSQLRKASVDTIAPVIVASFDIECYNPTYGFPDAADPACHVTQIATTFQRYGETEPFLRHVATLKECAPVDGVWVQSYDREASVLEAWASAIRATDVDFLVGYNIHGFDSQYMFARAQISGASGDFYRLGKLRGVRSKLTEKNMSSSAYGDNKFVFFETPGIMQLDVLTAVKRDYKLDSYKLDRVAEHFLGERKLDLPPVEIFKKWEAGTPEDIRTIAEYCVQDTLLPMRLVFKLNMVANLTELAGATGIPMSFLLMRGQQIRAVSLILKYVMEKGMLLPTNRKGGSPEEDKYVGATVLDPKVGAYFEHVSCLDFASLYPSIIRAYNLCHSTLVLDPAYSDCPGVAYDDVAWVEEGVSYSYRFVQSRKGVLPLILDDLTAARKTAKKKMAAATDPFEKELFNAKQLAFKVTSNSLYGVCGASNGILSCKPIASSVTATGRRMILETKEYVETRYPGSEVVYGDTDSVFVKFPPMSLADTFRVANEAADAVTQTFRKPIE